MTFERPLVGARMIETGVIAEGTGGYARGLNREERQQQHDVLAERLSHAHAVICAAAIPGRKAPLIVTEDMVDCMMPDSILVDMAAESGGNCELTRPGQTYTHGHTIIVGASNLPSSGAVHASELYSRNLYNMLKLLVVDGQLVLDWDDEVVASCILTHEGGLYHEPSAALMELEVVVKDTGERAAPANTGVSSAQDSSAGWIEEDTDVAERAAQEVAIESTAPSADDDEEDSDEVTDTDRAIEDATESESHDDAAADDDGEEAEAPPPQIDDLQVIDGIGPVLHSRLQEFGYLTYEDLAKLDDTAATQLGTQLELEEPESVVRWVEQAKGIRT